MQTNQDRLHTTQEAMQANLQALQAGQDRLQANQESMVTLLEELTQHTTANHRLWLRLAERYGWVDDEQNGAGPDPPT